MGTKISSCDLEGAETGIKFWKPEARHVFLFHGMICGGEWRVGKGPEGFAS